MEEEWGGIRIGVNVNLIPFHDIYNKTSILNIYFFIPVGFIIGFIIKNNLIRTLFIGSILSILIELSQMLVNTFIGINFRYTDINDVICNTAGAIIGYLFFLLFIRFVKMIYKNNNSKLMNYINSLV